jgi:hypothetical protein
LLDPDQFRILEEETKIARKSPGVAGDLLRLRLVEAGQVALQDDPVAPHEVDMLAKRQPRLKRRHRSEPARPWTEADGVQRFSSSTGKLNPKLFPI